MADGGIAPRIKPLPLALIEEVPKPLKVLTEVELIMTAWSEEQARYLFRLTMLVRGFIAMCLSLLIFYLYKSLDAADRRVRGVDFMPSGLRIGAVVYLDMSDNGNDAGRIVIGLLTENCPLYCEAFHRRCVGSGGDGDSFRGVKMGAMLPHQVCIFGDGSKMKHDVQGYNPDFLPTESKFEKPWRGALSSIAYGVNKESMNFAIHQCSGDFSPQIFGLVIGGYDIIEKMHSGGITHGAEPTHEWVVEGCGELCTLDKARVCPLPWRLYESVSRGYDADKFGPRVDPETLWPPQGGDAAESPGGRKKWFGVL